MKRSLLALALAGTSLFAAPASAEPISVTPGCDNPVDVVCNMGYCPEHACTPMICLVWIDGYCAVE